MISKSTLRLLQALVCLSALLGSAAFARPMCTISLSSAQNGQTLITPPSVSIALSGTLTCEEPLNVTIYDNGHAILTPGLSGGGFNYSFSTTWTNVPTGVHAFSATVDGAYDSATSDDSVVVTVLPPPTGSLSASPQLCNIPAGGSSCSSTISWSSNRANTGIWVTGLDNSNPQQFVGSGGATSGSQTAPWITSGGVRFHLRESAGAPDLATIDVHGNLPPDVAITAPPTGVSFYSPANITVSASASDADGSIQRVDFWADGAQIGTATAAPYQVTWNNAGAGSHAIQAVAYDNLGNFRSSNTSNITGIDSVVTGNIDGVTPDGVVSGWACSTSWSASINVDLYLGGPYGTGTMIGRYLANQSSEPAVASACKVGSGSYRFYIPITEAQRLQYAGKAIYVHGISPLGKSNNLLSASGNFVVPTPVPNAQFVGQSVNAAMQINASQTVTLQFKNTGTRTWTRVANFKLGPQNPPDNSTWGVWLIDLPNDVAPGQTASISFSIRAPGTPGTYNFQWQMQQQGVAWFGDLSTNVAITVTAPPPVVSTYSSVDYDELGRVMARRDSAGNVKMSYLYDGNGNVVSATDGLARVTKFEYDALNRLVKTTDPAGQVTQYAYDKADHLVQVTDARGLVTTYTYDGIDQLWTQASPDTGVTQFSYFGDGSRQSMIRNDGSSLTYSYDELARTTAVGNAQAQRVYSYDTCSNGKGRLCGMSVGDSNTSSSLTTFAYTPEGLLTERDDAIQGTENVTGYGYDDSGRLAVMNYPSGLKVNYGYAYGKLSAATLTANGVTTNLATGMSYQPLGPIAGWTVGNGLTRSYGYDADGRLTGISTGNASGVVQSLTYGLNLADEITAVTNGVSTGLSQTYSYDPLSRLTKQTYGSGGQQLREYDATGNLTHNNGPWDEYPVVDPASNRITSMGSHVYGYDLRGNRASYQFSTSAATYAYDAFNRLSQYARDVAVTFSEPNGPNGEPIYHPAGTWSYLYDAQDQRVGKSGPDGQTRYVYGEPGQLLAEYGPNGWKSYLWLGGQLVGVYSTNAGLGYIDTDHLGRPERVTNGVQQTVWSAANYGFGRTVLQDAIGGLNLGFPGQYIDAESGLWQNGFRDYDSRLGRYLESDPIGLLGGINTYAYTHNNPVTHTDLTGLDDTACMYDQSNCMGSGPYKAEVDFDFAHLTVSYVIGTVGFYYSRNGTLFVSPGVAHPDPWTLTNLKWPSISISGGILNGCDHTGQTVDNYLTGLSSGVSAYYWYGGSTSWNASGSAVELGFGSPGFSGQAFERAYPTTILRGHSW